MYARTSAGSGRIAKSDCWCSLASSTWSRSRARSARPTFCQPSSVAARCVSNSPRTRTPASARYWRSPPAAWKYLVLEALESKGTSAFASTPAARVSNRNSARSVATCTKHREARKACIASASTSTASSPEPSSERTASTVASGVATSVATCGNVMAGIYPSRSPSVGPNVEVYGGGEHERGSKAGEGPAGSRGQGHRRLRADRGGRPHPGRRLRGQGLPHPAVPADAAAAARRRQVRLAGGEPGPGPARLPRRDAGALLPGAGLPVPDAERGHLLHRPGEDRPGADAVLDLLPAPARHPLQRGGGAGLQQDRAGPPPRGPDRDAAAQPLLLRVAGLHAAQAAVGGRAEHRHPAAVLRAGEGHRRVRRAEEVPHHPLRPLRLAGEPAAEADEAADG